MTGCGAPIRAGSISPAPWMRSPRAMLLQIRLPAALPAFASGARIAAAVAPIGAVIGEWVGASAGLGYLMTQSLARGQTPLAFAALVLLCLLGLALYHATDRRRAGWYPGNCHKENDDAYSDPTDRGAGARKHRPARRGAGQGPRAARLVRQPRPRGTGDRQAARLLRQARARRRADRAGRSQCAAQAGGRRPGRLRRVVPADLADAGRRETCRWCGSACWSPSRSMRWWRSRTVR